MKTQQFEWTQPIGGKKVLWRPLTAGDQMDIEGNYSRSDIVHLKKYAELATRLIQIGDKQNVQLNDIRDWDEFDLTAFYEEVASRELARSVALSPQRTGGAVTALEQDANALQIALNKFAQTLTAVIQKAKEAEQKIGPLK